MAFDTLGGKTPTTIKGITIILSRVTEDVDGVPTIVERVRYKVVPADQDGNDMNPVHGNLVPRLSAPQIAGLRGFMDEMDTDAVAALP